MSLTQLSYCNAMEPLVAAEIEHQLQRLPEHLASAIDRSQAICYALNRLPPLYATTQEGWEWQQKNAQGTLRRLIVQAAGWGLQAAQRQPRNFSTPISAKTPISTHLVQFQAPSAVQQTVQLVTQPTQPAVAPVPHTLVMQPCAS